MKTQLVYDLPLRLFHWLFAGLFLFAFAVAKTIDDDSPIFTYHMLAGMTLSFLVVLRLIWGVVGTKYSRLKSFALHPRDLVFYFQGVLSGSKAKWTGHNPASSWAAIAMFTFALGLGVTGYLMSTGYKENFEDIHELLANGFLVTVLLHIAGVLLHSFRHQDAIAFSMLNGSKKEIPLTDGITQSRPLVAVLFLILITTFTLYLNKNFDAQKQTLHLLGTTLQLGESEIDSEHKFQNAEPTQNNEEDEDDD